MNLTISGYSTALFATWYFVEELGLLFDVGEGLTSNLLQKARKVNNVFISHADRDHLTGLFQFNQLNARSGFPIIHYPKDCGSFPAVESFSKQFDPHVTGTVWKPIVEGNRIWIREDVFVEAIRNSHVPAEGHISKSLGYKVVLVKRKVKAEFAILSGVEIKKIILELGKEKTTEEIHTTILCYSGDTPVENFEVWNGTKILIHEATFLGRKEDDKIETHGNKHSNLRDVLQMASTIQIEKLILGHFSSRYSAEQIDAQIQATCKEFAIEIPVFRILPGQAVFDILQQKPINR